MSGEPFSISSGAKTAQYGANSRAVIAGSTLPSDTLQAGTLSPVFFKNASAFALAPAGSTGMGRNIFQGRASGIWMAPCPRASRLRSV